jgi:hypothetical protein
MVRKKITELYTEGQVRYSIFAIFIVVILIIMSIVLIQRAPLTGRIVSDIIPESCSDSNITFIWDSILSEGSGDISLLKNDSLFSGQCKEYFANKSVGGLNYILYGFVEEQGGVNVSFVSVEVINVTENYTSVLKNITMIENVSLLPEKNETFLQDFVIPRGQNISSNDEANTEFDSFFDVENGTWEQSVFLGKVGYNFSLNLSDDVRETYGFGVVAGNYSYSLFYLTSKLILCEPDYRTCNDTNECDDDTDKPDERSCICSPNWNCTSWSNCTDGLQNRSCMDLYICGNLSSKPIENKTCEVEVVGVEEEVCTPSWSCSGWGPEECPEEETQSRTCTDANNCGTSEGKPSETRTCVFEKPNGTWVFVVIIVIVILMILVVISLIILIFYFLKRRSVG